MTSRTRLLFVTSAMLLATLLGTRSTLREAAADPVEIDLSVFYTALEPHGDWVHLQPYGWAWVPDNVDYGWRPYTVGQWSWVEPYGWTWLSNEPWGWATYHYGRWTYVEDYGWAWVPGTTWAPAWVAFRYGDPWVGWAPLPPGPTWRYDATPDVASLNADISLGAHAWSFVQLRFFAATDLRLRVLVTAHNPFLVERTAWSTRYASIEGGYANHSLALALVERAHNARIPRHRIREAPSLEQGAVARVEGGSVVLYRPRIARREPTRPPTVRAPGARLGPATVDPQAWAAQRAAALRAHLEAQRRALEQPDALPGGTRPGTAPDADAPRRREAALKALADEKQRLEALHEHQRKRRERAQHAHRGADADGHGKKDDGQGKRDDAGEDDDKQDPK